MSVTGDDAPSPPDIRFDPLDSDQVRLLLRLSPGERIRVMSVDAQALAKRLIKERKTYGRK